MPERNPQILEPGGTEVITPAGGAHHYRKPLRTLHWSEIKHLLAESFAEWSRQKGSRLGASLAFYTLLSITPLLLIAVSIGALFFGHKIAESQIIQQIEELMGPQGVRGIQSLLSGVQNTTHGVLATAAGVATLLFGASGVLVELRDALNTIWEVPEPETPVLRSLVQIVKDRLFSFALVLAIGFLLLVSLILNAWIVAAGTYFSGLLLMPASVLNVLNALVSFLITTVLFAAIYKILPDPRLEWRDVLLGAAVTSFLFTIGKFLLGLYLGKASFVSTYGAAASIIIMVVWVYYSGQIFFFGAEFTKVFTARYGSGAPVNAAPPRAEKPGVLEAGP